MAADGKWVRKTARTAADGVGAREWLEMGGETKPLEISELGCADGCGRQWVGRIARTAADGVGAREWLEMGGEKKPLEIRELGCADGCGREMVTAADGKWVGRIARTAADGVRAREQLEMVGEKKPLGMSQLGLRCGRQIEGENCAYGAAGDQRVWLRRRLRTGNGCGELRGRLRTAWVQGSGWKWLARRSRW